MANLERLKYIWKKYLVDYRVYLDKNTYVYFGGNFLNGKPIYHYIKEEIETITYFSENDRWFGVRKDTQNTDFSKFFLLKSPKCQNPLLAPASDPRFCLTIYNHHIQNLLQFYDYNKFEILDEKRKKYILGLKNSLKFLPEEIIDMILSYLMLVELA